MPIRGFMEIPKDSGVPAVGRGEFDSLVRRVSALEQKVRLLSSPPFTDQTKVPYDWGDRVGEPYYHHRGDIAGSLRDFVPWISTTTRFSERLTSIEFLKVTVGQALVIGISFGAMGGLVSWGFGYPFWPLVIVPGASGFFLSIGTLILVNRMEIHALVKGQADRDKKKRTEMRVQIDKPGTYDMEFLYLNSHITRDQLREFARAALDGASLGVHKWTGQGALFTRGQFDDLMSELEKMGYIRPARGNVSRSLNAKGRALMRGLSEGN